MAAKTQQIQIRVTPQQKAALKRQAGAAGQDVSEYVLARLLPPRQDRFADLAEALNAPDHRFALAELNDFLTDCPRMLFREAVARAPRATLSPFLANYLAAMVEQAAALKGVTPPSWTRDITPLASPRFATSMLSLRMHLLRSAPVPFKRRNIFVDSAIGARV